MAVNTPGRPLVRCNAGQGRGGEVERLVRIDHVAYLDHTHTAETIVTHDIKLWAINLPEANAASLPCLDVGRQSSLHATIVRPLTQSQLAVKALRHIAPTIFVL